MFTSSTSPSTRLPATAPRWRYGTLCAPTAKATCTSSWATSTQRQTRLPFSSSRYTPHAATSRPNPQCRTNLTYTTQGKASLNGRATTLRDAWLEIHEEPPPRSPNETLRQHHFTFPSDDPHKRIDFVLLGTPPNCQQRVHHTTTTPTTPTPQPSFNVTSVHLFGQAPYPGTEHLEGQGYGMVHANSPLYASDHRGVVTDVRLAASACS